MNLENFGLVELNAQDVQETDGGIYLLPGTEHLIIGASVVVQAYTGLWNGFWNGIHGN
jgi:hypothetical protein